MLVLPNRRITSPEIVRTEGQAPATTHPTIPIQTAPEEESREDDAPICPGGYQRARKHLVVLLQQASGQL